MQIVCRLDNGLTGILERNEFGDDNNARRAFATRVQVHIHPAK
jgi:hypothetical protein